LIDFIRSKNFAGGFRPEIEISKIDINNNEIDIIVIFDRPYKPYYLDSDFQGLKANHIYTRTNDSNTPKNKSADLYVVEKMWRQRSADQNENSPSDWLFPKLPQANPM